YWAGAGSWCIATSDSGAEKWLSTTICPTWRKFPGNGFRNFLWPFPSCFLPLLAEVFFARAHVVALILGADLDTVPLSIIEGMVGVVADTVLIPQFGGNFVQSVLNFVAAAFARPSRHEPGLPAAGVGER